MAHAGEPFPGKTIPPGQPFEFGPDEPRVELLCAECDAVLDTVPPDFQFRNLFFGEVLWICGCGTENVAPLAQGEDRT